MSLEAEKLKLEIKNLKLPWYKKLEFWKVLIPTLAVLITLYYTVGKGIIDAEKANLEIQKEQLKLEILRFEIEKKEVQEDLLEVQIELETKSNQISKLNAAKDSLTHRVEFLNRKINSSEKILGSISQTHQKDKDFYRAELKKEYEKEKKRIEQLQLLEKELEKTQLALVEAQTESLFYKSRTNLTHLDSLNLSMKISQAKSAFYDSKSSDIDELIRTNEKRYQEELDKINKMSAEEIIRWWELYFLRED